MSGRGFTLIELVVVIAVAGILALMVFPRFASKSAFDQAGYKAQLISAMQYGRKIAVASRRYVCVSVSGNALSLTLDPNLPDSLTSASVNCSVALNLPGSNSATTTAPSGITLGSASFRFNPSGEAVSTSGASTSVSVAVGSSSSSTQTLYVESSGYVH